MASKYWIFTQNNIDDKPQWDKNSMDFLIYQKEKAPSTGKLHWQGYVEFKKPVTLKKAKDLLECLGAHLEKRKGSAWQAMEYCRKEESAAEDEYFIMGTEPKEDKKGQGHRSDLEELAKACIRGESLQELDLKFPGPMLKYDRHAERMKQRHVKSRFEKTEVVCIWGRSGLGKSKIVAEIAQNAHWQSGIWWDGYTGQSMVVMDDFDEKIYSRKFLLNLFDRYPLKVPIKGAMLEFVSKQLILTTCERPEWILSDPEMARRIEVYELQEHPLAGGLMLVACRPQGQP